MSKKVDLVALIANMSDDERNALGLALKENDVKITARKSKPSAVYVARRMNLKDTSPNAKRVRFAGTIEYLTERQVKSVLSTWVRKTKDETPDAYATRLGVVISSILDNDNGVWSNNNLRIESITHTDNLDDLPLRFNTEPSTE